MMQDVLGLLLNLGQAEHASSRRVPVVKSMRKETANGELA